MGRKKSSKKSKVLVRKQPPKFLSQSTATKVAEDLRLMWDKGTLSESLFWSTLELYEVPDEIADNVAYNWKLDPDIGNLPRWLNAWVTEEQS